MFGLVSSSGLSLAVHGRAFRYRSLVPGQSLVEDRKMSELIDVTSGTVTEWAQGTLSEWLPGIVTTETGIQYRVTEIGDGEFRVESLRGPELPRCYYVEIYVREIV